MAIFDPDKTIVWKDRQGRPYTLNQLDDRHLSNIGPHLRRKAEKADAETAACYGYSGNGEEAQSAAMGAADEAHERGIRYRALADWFEARSQERNLAQAAIMMANGV